jgi:hypothetical protein
VPSDLEFFLPWTETKKGKGEEKKKFWEEMELKEKKIHSRRRSMGEKNAATMRVMGRWNCHPIACHSLVTLVLMSHSSPCPPNSSLLNKDRVQLCVQTQGTLNENKQERERSREREREREAGREREREKQGERERSRERERERSREREREAEREREREAQRERMTE